MAGAHDLMNWQPVFVSFISSVVIAVVVAMVTVRLALKRFHTEKWWERKSTAYVSIIEALHHMRDHADTNLTFALMQRDLQDDGAEQLRLKMAQGLSELRKQRDMGDLVLSPAAVALMNALLQELSESPRTTSWEEHLEMNLIVIDKCLLHMRVIARDDLRVD